MSIFFGKETLPPKEFISNPTASMLPYHIQFSSYIVIKDGHMRVIVRLFLIAAFVMTLANTAFCGETQLAHAIFVKVNGETITQEQVVQVVKYLVQQEYNGVMPEDEEELEKIQDAALRDLIRSLLIRSEARKSNVSISSARLKNLIRQSGLKQDDVTPAIRKILEADDLFEDLMAITGTPVRDPSPGQIRDFYNKNRDEFKSNSFIIVRTIFIADDGKHPQAFYKAQAEELLEEIKKAPLNRRTDYFAEMAKEYSQDVFAQFGGLLTAESPEKWIPRDFNNKNQDGSDIFPATMVEGIRRLKKPGDIRLAVSADGMHLLYCEDARGGKVMKWDEARTIIEFILKARTRNRQLRIWLNQIYDRSDVRWHDGTPYEKEYLTKILLPSEQGPLNE